MTRGIVDACVHGNNIGITCDALWARLESGNVWMALSVDDARRLIDSLERALQARQAEQDKENEATS
jgi:hypothetical protein